MYKFILLFIMLVSSACVKAQQIVNDDCSTAIEFFLVPFTTGTQQCNNGIWDWIGGHNLFQSATPSIPSYTMSGCQGYSNSTTINSDDIWYKFKSNTPSRDIWLDGGDSLNISFYHGTNCGSLLPSGCFTYLPAYHDTIFSIYTSSDSLEFNFIQVSSIGQGREFIFTACVRDWGRPDSVLPFGTIHISTGIDEFNSYSSIHLYPNPCQSTISFASQTLNNFDFYLFDIYGRKLKYCTISEKVALNISEFLSGIYYYEIRGSNGKIKAGKLVKE